MTDPAKLARIQLNERVEKCKEEIMQLIANEDVSEGDIFKSFWGRYSSSTVGLALSYLREDNFIFIKDRIVYLNIHKDQLTLF